VGSLFRRFDDINYISHKMLHGICKAFQIIRDGDINVNEQKNSGVAEATPRGSMGGSMGGGESV
jgi:hypothetical protein